MNLPPWSGVSILSVISFLSFRLVTLSSNWGGVKQTLAERNSDTAERREDIRDPGKYLVTREQKIKSPTTEIWSREKCPESERYLDKDDQLDNWIIFGPSETFLFFTFPISSVATDWQPPSYTHCDSERWLWLQSEDDIWSEPRPPRSVGWIMDCFKAARFESRTQANIYCTYLTTKMQNINTGYFSSLKSPSLEIQEAALNIPGKWRKFPS